MLYPFPCSPVIHQWLWQKTQIEKKNTRLMAILYHLAFQLIIWYIIENIAKFRIVPATILFPLGLFFFQDTLFSHLLLTISTIASSILICWFDIANFVRVSDKLDIWSQRFQRSGLTITLPLRLVICWTRWGFFSALIVLPDKLNRLLDVLLSIIILMNECLDKSRKGRGTA